MKTFNGMKLIYIILLLSFFNSYSQDKFPKKNYVFGVVQTCIIDSSSFFNKDTIVIELGERDVNMSCSNRPKFSGCCAPWPTYVSFSSDDKSVFVGTNKELKRKENSDIVESLSCLPRFGKYVLSKKNKLITITFDQYKWAQKYRIKHNETRQLLILIRDN